VSGLTWEALTPALAARVRERLEKTKHEFDVEKTMTDSIVPTVSTSTTPFPLKWSVQCGDARLLIPDDFVADAMIVDPPYSDHVHENTTSQDQHTDGNVRHNDLGFAPLTPELQRWICALAARTRRWSLIYTDVESVADWKRELEVAGATYIRTIPWVRWSMPALSGDRPPQGFECIIVAYGSAKGRKRWNGAGNLVRLAHTLDWDSPNDLLAHLADSDDLTHLAHLALRGKDKFKTEKPFDQLLDLVSWFSEPNEVVIDPTSGSGTTGLACKVLGRSFVGCELSSAWAAKASLRIDACVPQWLSGQPIAGLSTRDRERFERYVNASEVEKGKSLDRKTNTDRVRKRMADKKLAASGAVATAGPTLGTYGGFEVPEEFKQKVSEVVNGKSSNTKTLIIEKNDTLWTVSEHNDGADVWELEQRFREVDGVSVYLQPPTNATIADVNQWIQIFKKNGARIAMVDPNSNWTGMPSVWIDAYKRCLVDVMEQRYPGPPVAHCGSVSCLLRPLQTDERETACGCGCLPCTKLSAHLRPPTPKTSAAERTVPLFDPPFEDEYAAKKWREAYERCRVEFGIWNVDQDAKARCQEKMGDLQCLRLAGHEENHTANPLALNDVKSVSTTEAELRCPACIDEPVRCEACRAFLNGQHGAIAPTTTGVVPPHVFAELGMHPALVDQPVVNRACVRAKHEGWPTNWLTLQERAPVGFFMRVLKEMDMEPGERLSVLVEAVRERGVQVGVYDAAGWSRFQREVVRAWIAQGSDRPALLDKYADGEAGTLGSCAACERDDKRPFTHTCEKGEALGESKQPAPPPTAQLAPAQAPKRGRPPGTKNKAPKAWKDAYTRCTAELGKHVL
jgi:hypothetical protein